MEEKIDEAIEILAGKIVQTVKPDEALKYTQAAQNLAHVKGILTELRSAVLQSLKLEAEKKERGKTKGAGSQPASKA